MSEVDFLKRMSCVYLCDYRFNGVEVSAQGVFYGGHRKLGQVRRRRGGIVCHWGHHERAECVAAVAAKSSNGTGEARDDYMGDRSAGQVYRGIPCPASTTVYIPLGEVYYGDSRSHVKSTKTSRDQRDVTFTDYSGGAQVWCD